MFETVRGTKRKAVDFRGLALALCLGIAGFGTSPEANAYEKYYTPEGERIPYKMIKDWRNTDFSTYSIPLFDFQPAGPRKDEIPAINDTRFRNVDSADRDSLEPVITLTLNGEAKAWPISILLWHEIVNDTMGDVPIAVTFSPLTNSSRIFIREIDGKETTFGTSGLHLDTGQVIYDRATHSWWPQMRAEAVFGASTGARLTALPARIEGLGAFATRNPDGRVLIPSIKGYRPYGRTPYPRYDTSDVAYHYKGAYNGAVPPMTRVIAVGNEAFSLDLIRARGTLEAAVEGPNGTEDIRMRFVKGQKSPFDKPVIANSRDIGFVVVERQVDGAWTDAVHDVPFAYAWKAFHPHHSIHH